MTQHMESTQCFCSVILGPVVFLGLHPNDRDFMCLGPARTPCTKSPGLLASCFPSRCDAPARAYLVHGLPQHLAHKLEELQVVLVNVGRGRGVEPLVPAGCLQGRGTERGREPTGLALCFSFLTELLAAVSPAPASLKYLE